MPGGSKSRQLPVLVITGPKMGGNGPFLTVLAHFVGFPIFRVALKGGNPYVWDKSSLPITHLGVDNKTEGLTQFAFFDQKTPCQTSVHTGLNIGVRGFFHICVEFSPKRFLNASISPR